MAKTFLDLGCRAQCELKIFSASSIGEYRYDWDFGDNAVSGHVTTPYGIVGVFSCLEKEDSEDSETALVIILGQKRYTGTIKDAYSKKYLLTLAKEFARQCHDLFVDELESEFKSLAIFLAHYYKLINELREKCLRASLDLNKLRELVVMRWPIIQGSYNQSNLKKIGLMTFDANLVSNAVDRLCGIEEAR